MSFNFDLVDSSRISKFKCFQMKDSSIYFGEVAWMDELGNIFEEPPANPDENTSIRRVRHGVGIQLFGTTEDNLLCKYEGEWDCDQRSGEGICIFPDKSKYHGTLKNAIKDGYGKFTWPNGDSYEGNWRNERMDGGGKFMHHGDNVLVGMFKNNYYNKGENQYYNPFLSKEELEKVEKRKKDIAQFKESTRSQQLFTFEKTDSTEVIVRVIKNSNSKNRIPVILTSKSSEATKSDVFESISKYQNKTIYEFDLRYASEMKHDPSAYQEYMKKVKKNLACILTKGQTFCINIDDTTAVKYDELFDPDLREFYDASTFPAYILDLQELTKKEVYDNVLIDTEYRAEAFNKNYQMIIWSKFRINGDFDRKKIVEKFERRFSSILPVTKLDLILIP